MKLLDIKYYLDGGSFGVSTDEGDFWIDFSLNSKSLGDVYSGNINEKHPQPANQPHKGELLYLLCELARAKFVQDRFDENRLKK